MVSEGGENHKSGYVLKTKSTNVFQGEKRDQNYANAAIRSKDILYDLTSREASFTYTTLDIAWTTTTRYWDLTGCYYNESSELTIGFSDMEVTGDPDKSSFTVAGGRILTEVCSREQEMLNWRQ